MGDRDLTESEKQQIRSMFDEVDVDHSGFLSKAQFDQFIAKSVIKCPFLFEIVDVDGDGKISFDEFLELVKRSSGITLRGHFAGYIQLVFDSCDKGKKGKLTPLEFRRFMEFVGQSVEAFTQGKNLKISDSDGNGTIDFEEIMANLDLTSVKHQFGVRELEDVIHH